MRAIDALGLRGSSWRPSEAGPPMLGTRHHPDPHRPRAGPGLGLRDRQDLGHGGTGTEQLLLTNAWDRPAKGRFPSLDRRAGLPRHHQRQRDRPGMGHVQPPPVVADEWSLAPSQARAGVMDRRGPRRSLRDRRLQLAPRYPADEHPAHGDRHAHRNHSQDPAGRE